MPNGAAALCPGSFRFRSPNGQWYRFSFQPENYPDVDRFKVTCVAVDDTGCKVGTISPSGTVMTADDPNPKSLNKLLLITDQVRFSRRGQLLPVILYDGYPLTDVPTGAAPRRKQPATAPGGRFQLVVES